MPSILINGRQVPVEDIKVSSGSNPKKVICYSRLPLKGGDLLHQGGKPPIPGEKCLMLGEKLPYQAFKTCPK